MEIQEDALNFPTSFRVDSSVLTQSSGASQLISGFLLKGICLQIIVDLLYLYGEGGSKSFLF